MRTEQKPAFSHQMPLAAQALPEPKECFEPHLESPMLCFASAKVQQGGGGGEKAGEKGGRELGPTRAGQSVNSEDILWETSAKPEPVEP